MAPNIKKRILKGFVVIANFFMVIGGAFAIYNHNKKSVDSATEPADNSISLIAGQAPADQVAQPEIQTASQQEIQTVANQSIDSSSNAAISNQQAQVDATNYSQGMMPPVVQMQQKPKASKKTRTS